jgi:hypothetical protein
LFVLCYKIVAIHKHLDHSLVDLKHFLNLSLRHGSSCIALRIAGTTSTGVVGTQLDRRRSVLYVAQSPRSYKVISYWS